MKALLEPKMATWGIDYLPRFTEKFKNFIASAEEKIRPFSEKEISRDMVYFKFRGEELPDEFDCCDNKICIKQAKADIRKKYGKGIHLEEWRYSNDGDHERIEICNQCGKPLNEWLTWCESELEYLEENKPWSVEFFKNEGFLIHCIFQSSPTLDYEISERAKYQGGEILKKELETREQFFQRLGELAKNVIEKI